MRTDSGIVRWLGDISITHDLAPAEQRSVWTTGYGSVLALGIQALTAVIVFFLGAGVLALAWLAASGLFVLPLLLARAQRPVAAPALLLLVCHVQVLTATYYLGFDSGSSLYLALGCVFPFMLFRESDRGWQWGFASVAAIEWVGITLLQSYLPPRIQLADPVGNQAFNTLVVSGALFAIVGGFLAVISARAAALGAAKSRAAALTELGAYRLGQRIGEGGMGEVWTAHHRMLARPAAIKLIRPERLGPDAEVVTTRFIREARATAELRSPHTIELFDFGQTDSGMFYYVMELLDGIDLSGFVAHFGPMPPGRVVRVLRQVCLSLAEAHEAGLVHRDIKPANIFICQLGGQPDFVKVLDFGLVTPGLGEGHDPLEGSVDLDRAPPEPDAPNLAVDDATDPGITQANQLMGTPAFMSPEQALRTDVDGRTDIYALGCVGYWLLTGQAVFTADEQLDVLVAQIEHTPSPPSSVAQCDIPAPLEALLLRCLAKDAEDRPQSAGWLAEELRKIEEQVPWTDAEAAQWWEDHDRPTGPVWPPEPATTLDGETIVVDLRS